LTEEAHWTAKTYTGERAWSEEPRSPYLRISPAHDSQQFFAFG